MLNKVSDSEMSLSMAPDIVVTVYDEGREGEDYVGGQHIPLSFAKRDETDSEDEKSKKMKREPIWLELQHEDLNYNRERLCK